MTTIVFGAGASAVTWTEARDQVRADLWKTATGLPDNVVDRALHASLRRLESERNWLWLEQINATFTTATAANFLQAPSDMRGISSIAYLNGTRGYDLITKKPLALVRDCAVGSIGGTPEIYNFSNSKIWLDTTVDAGSQFDLIYKSKTPDLIDDAIATPPATLTVQQAGVFAGACWHVALNYLKNEEEASRQDMVYTSFLDTLIQEEEAARDDGYGGLIQPDTSYHQAAFGNGIRYG